MRIDLMSEVSNSGDGGGGGPAATSSPQLKQQQPTTARRPAWLLPWGAPKDRPNVTTSGDGTRLVDLERKKPGEYLMNLIVFNFIQTSARKLDQITNEKRVSTSNLHRIVLEFEILIINKKSKNKF